MSYLVNDPTAFADEMTAGLCAVHPDLVRPTRGGVVRAGGTPAGQVAVVIGGGSGHYPAFAGLVGRGLAHGAAMGNVFASPSAQQVHAVARAAEAGGGVLFSYGNYAGDVLNFDLAQEQLRSEGIDTRTVTVTDDVSSAPADQRGLRRGVAGDLVVFKVAAWAAEQGRPLDAVVELAERANERTRTLGVAFSGCTLPGAEAPLFSVPEGRMAVGMGIHGEPGLSEEVVPRADDLADDLVERLLAETPDGAGPRVAVVLNGLGSVKTEELFVVYRRVHETLRQAGLVVVAPQVGEFATSFEMAGLSLTLVWLDEDLERAWTAPAHTPGFVRVGTFADDGADIPDVPRTSTAPGAIAPVTARPDSSAGVAGAAPTSSVPLTEEAAAAAGCVARSIRAVRAEIEVLEPELGRLDAVAGDGDHGIGMRRGVEAAAAAADAAVAAGHGPGATLRAAAEAWADRAGGTSGALWGMTLSALAARLPEGAAYAADLADGVGLATEAVMRAGGAVVGDKTMVDVLVPFAASLAEQASAGLTLPQAWSVAVEVASGAAAGTTDLVPAKGRSRTHAERSVGTPDPGAVSLAAAVAAVGRVLTRSGTPVRESTIRQIHDGRESRAQE